MALTVTEVPNRQALTADPEADHQPWTGIGGENKALRYTRMRSAARRCWCAITDAAKFVRKTQGSSFAGHFAEHGDLVIDTNQTPGRTFRVDFDLPVKAIGLDVEPEPAAVVPGQKYRAVLTLTDPATGDSAEIVKVQAGGSSCFLGARCDTDSIGQAEVRVVMLDAAGAEQPVDFGTNRIELIAPVGNVV